MSHITVVKTQLDNIELIKKALDYLGLSYEENSKIRMWRSSKEALLAIKLKNYDIGVQKDNEGIYYLEADAYAWNEVQKQPALKEYHLKYDSNGLIFGGILKQACNIVKSAIIADAHNQRIEFSKPDKNNIITGKVRDKV